MRVVKQIGRSQRTDRDRVDTALLSPEEEPRPQGCRKLAGRDEYHIRVRNYRIIYDVDDERMVVEVLRVAHRREVYRKR